LKRKSKELGRRERYFVKLRPKRTVQALLSKKKEGCRTQATGEKEAKKDGSGGKARKRIPGSR